MNRARALVIAAGLVVGAQSAIAQDMSRYRAYVLESTVDSVVAASGARAADTKTLHQRPATIQELQWRAPYSSPSGAAADPVRDIAFTFYNDSLYQVVVNYDRDRTAGLTSADVIDSISTTYGLAVLASAKPRSGAVEEYPGNLVVARWDSPETSLTLVRGAYTPSYQLILLSKPLNLLARTAIGEANRLDEIEGPRRELEQRQREASDAGAALDKTRTANKASFRP